MESIKAPGQPMIRNLNIDFVSDVACPWCIIGLKSLDLALERVADVATAEITFHPFELNAQMPAGGQNMLDHVGEKYGIQPDEARGNREKIRARAASLGFTMGTSDSSRIYNTFDSHRLLQWALTEGRQGELKRSLFTANFTEQRDPGDHEVLVSSAQRAGLNPDAARRILESDAFAGEVRTQERYWANRGIQGVPAIIINDRYFVSGAQPPEVFEHTLREIAAAA